LFKNSIGRFAGDAIDACWSNKPADFADPACITACLNCAKDGNFSPPRFLVNGAVLESPASQIKQKYSRFLLNSVSRPRVNIDQTNATS
jgi:hypothetical protein